MSRDLTTIFVLFCLTNTQVLCNPAAPPYKVIKYEDAEPYKAIPSPPIDEKETESQYWREKSSDELNQKLWRKTNTNLAKNVIFFLGDGMSISTITAARIYKGQKNKRNGEEGRLFFENFPYTGLSKTYCVDRQVTDSASASTAYMSGVKGNYMTIGVNANVKSADCESAKKPSNRPSSIVKWAQDSSRSTGIVTNTRITHASPAGAYAHVPYRSMESDWDNQRYQLDPNSCNFDIAKQLVCDEPGKNIKVLLGGGRQKFLLQKDNSSRRLGERQDKDLIQEWKNDKIQRKANGVYVTTAQQLQNIDIDKTDYLLGLFAPSHMHYSLHRPDDEPSLSQMTETAIKILQKDPKGFFLFVEGGAIDMAHHYNEAKHALDETLEFDRAIETAAKLTSEEDTLIVVTADHSTTMSINGYPARGFDILGIYGKSSQGKPYATLSYANGPGYKRETVAGIPHDLETDNMTDPFYQYPAMVHVLSATHGGDDVAVYARGPWAHLFTGNYEQSYIPIAEAYAADIRVPQETSSKDDDNKKNSSIRTTVNLLTIMTTTWIIFYGSVIVMF